MLAVKVNYIPILNSSILQKTISNIKNFLSAKVSKKYKLFLILTLPNLFQETLQKVVMG